MKSTLVVLCGESFEPGDSHRESAYAYYYLGIAVGAMLSGIIVGAAAESYGWQYGFGVAAVGMAVALGLYLALAPRWLANIGARPAPRTRLPAQVPASVPRRDSAARREDLRRIRLLLVLATLLCVFSVGWFQMFGSWALFLERWVDRRVGSLVIPVPWFSSWQGLVVIVLTPFVANWLLRRAARNRQVDIVQKYVFALGTVGCGHLLMWIGALGARADSPAPLWIPIVAFGVIALGELVAWTATYGVVSRAAPAGLASMTMGAWYLLTLGLGGYLSGFFRSGSRCLRICADVCGRGPPGCGLCRRRDVPARTPKAPGGERGRLDLTHPQADALRLTAVVLRRAAQLGAAVV
jgi:POT family proton-dependent oligopeptide transporter